MILQTDNVPSTASQTPAPHGRYLLYNIILFKKLLEKDVNPVL